MSTRLATALSKLVPSLVEKIQKTEQLNGVTREQKLQFMRLAAGDVFDTMARAAFAISQGHWTSGEISHVHIPSTHSTASNSINGKIASIKHWHGRAHNSAIGIHLNYGSDHAEVTPEFPQWWPHMIIRRKNDMEIVLQAHEKGITRDQITFANNRLVQALTAPGF